MSPFLVVMLVDLLSIAFALGVGWLCGVVHFGKDGYWIGIE